MGKPGAYLNLDRVDHGVRASADAVADFDEFVVPLPLEAQEAQASRCMACGVAFCQTGMVFSGERRPTGCPLHNCLPEVNDLLYRGRLKDAYERLSLTNPFPEFTGRVCPAPCEVACNLGLHEQPVTIHDNERAVSDYAWAHGLVKPLTAPRAQAPLVSVIGSGPAGLAAAWELARRGARVQVIERADRAGGLLMYGIPNMKLDKDVVARRIELMEESGIVFKTSMDAAACAAEIQQASAAVVIASGAGAARRVDVPGADLAGVEFALDYLEGATRALIDGGAPAITAAGKDVVVIGGGDTGVDCIATALRQGAASVTQVIRAQRPADTVNVFAVWPGNRNVYAQGYGQVEAQDEFGADPRLWSTDTVAFTGEGSVAGVRIEDLSYEGGRHRVEGTEREIPAQLVLIAKGFTGPEKPLLDAFGVSVGERSLPVAEGYRTATASLPVYVAGDCRVGSTLVSSSIADGLQCAYQVADDLGL
jgi:glutamate synthase (NADPH/NADH) small chain